MSDKINIKREDAEAMYLMQAKQLYHLGLLFDIDDLTMDFIHNLVRLNKEGCEIIYHEIKELLKNPEYVRQESENR